MFRHGVRLGKGPRMGVDGRHIHGTAAIDGDKEADPGGAALFSWIWPRARVRGRTRGLGRVEPAIAPTAPETGLQGGGFGEGLRQKE